MVGAIALTACSQPAKKQPLGADLPAIAGIGDYRLGVSFRDLAYADSGRWNAAALRECLDDRVLRGCYLMDDDDKVAREERDGIPYRVTLEFSRFDKLVRVTFKFDREGGISFDQCRDLHARSVDWVTDAYGPLVDRLAGKGDTSDRRTLRSAKGRTFVLPVFKGGYIAMSRTTPRRPVKKGVDPFYAAGEERNAEVFSTFFPDMLGKPQCSIWVSVQEPDGTEGYVMSQEDSDALRKAQAKPTVVPSPSPTVDEGDVPPDNWEGD